MRRAIVVLLLLSGGCSPENRGARGADLRVRRDTFLNRISITGELESRRGETLSVPRMPTWETTLKWVVEDGAFVRKGERVAELAAGQLPSQLESNRQAEMQAGEELQQRNSEWKADLEQKQFDVDKKRAEFDKARIQAAVPDDLLSAREAQERKLTVERTQTALEKAIETFTSRQKAVEAERANLELKIAQARREIGRSSLALASLVMPAPQDGIVVLRELPWLGRKLRPGDQVWVGYPIAVMPELSSLEVTAWLPDVDDGRVRVGQPAIVTLDGYPAEHFRGRIRSVAAVAQDTARTSQRRHFRVSVALDSVNAEKMRPGLSTRVDIEREKRDNVLIAPRSAIVFDGAKARAVLRGGRLADIQVSTCSASECVIQGLEDGTALSTAEGLPDA